jgi:hypothetical protein
MGSSTLLVTAGGTLTVLWLADGSVQWSGPLGDPGADVHSPIVVGQVAYVVDEGELVRLTMESGPDRR